MDTLSFAYSPSRLRSVHGSARAPLVVDVRRASTMATADRLIAGATWRDPEAVADWAPYLPRHRAIVVYCVHGYEISTQAAEALRAGGLQASPLTGGFAAWLAAGGPTGLRTPAIPSPLHRPTRWITRERPKVDRIACPWLIRRFIDPFAEFLYVPSEAVRAGAAETGAVPFDIPGVQYTHREERCSFDAFIEDHGLAHPALDRLACIVRGADTDCHDLAAEAPGLHALSLGLSDTLEADADMLAAGMTMYDALYAWCKACETGPAANHSWGGSR